MSTPLHVFEDRYRTLVRDLLEQPDPTRRLFGIVAIREGYEVGAHEARSMYRIGCAVQLRQVRPYDDGRFDIETVGRHRMRVDAVDASGPYLTAEVAELTDDPPPELTDESLRAAAARALATFEDYRHLLTELRGDEVLAGTMPKDPELLSYSLAASALLSLRERQSLLEASSAYQRLELVRYRLAEEIRAMQVLPSLPATEVARTGWSPN
ncbi:MAG: LON peptidase substrate-binding domain-containing protein [Nocardioidaceae bacterium]|nr:MAG: LON peptidase substrate-binding domain-containing protein [Nocardioidaceae bacterium]